LQALVPPGRRELDNEVHVEELQRLQCVLKPEQTERGRVYD